MYKIANKIAPKYLIDMFQIRKLMLMIRPPNYDLYPTETLLYQSQTLIYLRIVFHTLAQ